METTSEIRHSRQTVLTLVAIIIAAGLLSGCAPNVQSDMNRAARNEALSTTQSLGTPAQIRLEVTQASSLLREIALRVPGQADNMETVWGGFHEIASSRTDDEFARAVLEMCTPERSQAARAAGDWMLTRLAETSARKPPQGQRAIEVSDYIQNLGGALIQVGQKCDEIQNHLQVALGNEAAAVKLHDERVQEAEDVVIGILGGAALAGSTALEINATYARGYYSGVPASQANVAAPTAAPAFRPNPSPPLNFGGLQSNAPPPQVPAIPAQLQFSPAN